MFLYPLDISSIFRFLYCIYLSVKLNGLGTVGCQSFELLGGKLFVSISSPSMSLSPLLSLLSSLFESLHILQLLLVKCISLLRIVFASLSLYLDLKSTFVNNNKRIDIKVRNKKSGVAEGNKIYIWKNKWLKYVVTLPGISMHDLSYDKNYK